MQVYNECLVIFLQLLSIFLSLRIPVHLVSVAVVRAAVLALGVLPPHLGEVGHLAHYSLIKIGAQVAGKGGGKGMWSQWVHII